MIVGSISVKALRISFIVSISCKAIKSKRNPSILYSVAQYVTESIMNLRIIERSEAVSLPQPEPFENPPSVV